MNSSQLAICDCFYGARYQKDTLNAFLGLALNELQFSVGPHSEIRVTRTGKSKLKMRFTMTNVGRLLEDESVEGFSIVEQFEESLRQTDFKKIIFFQHGCVNVSAVCTNYTLEVPKLQRLVIEGSLLLNSSYSFMTILHYGFLPPLWCGGIASGYALQTLSASEIERIGRWMNLGVLEKEFERGRLRGVYELNILNECQARINIEGRPLLEWIDHYKHGIWHEIADNKYQWKIERKKCFDIERILLEHGVIV